MIARLVLASVFVGLLAPPAAAEPPLVHASATCAAASKPGRIRCRAVLELPIERAATARIAWAELRVSGGHPAVAPLRGRLGPLDAETRDDARVVWSFSVAAQSAGELPLELRLLATIQPKAGPPAFADARVPLVLKVASDQPPK